MANSLKKIDAAYQGAKVTPLDAGLIERVKQGVSYIIRGVAPAAWFGPAQPLTPVSQESAGRTLDYPVGFNVNIAPRSYEPVSFDQMRALADGYDLLRLVIETRKDQVAKLKWRIKTKEDAGKKAAEASKSRIDQVTEFFTFPDKEHTWSSWLRMILEDMLVVDASTIYPRMTKGGQPYGFEVMDGATITRKLNADGRTPVPPDCAYQQIIKGVPMADYHRDELIYYPRNLRAHKVYGYSPVEQIIITVNIALRRQIYQLNYYTEGNIPEALCKVPESWTSDQIKQFQTWWDSLMEGNLAQRRHMKFIPGGMDLIETKANALKDEMDEWLARVVCFAFSISHQPFTKEVNRATAETAQKAALQEGLAPIQLWITDLVNMILWKYLGQSDLEFAWEEEDDTSPDIQCRISDRKIRNGSLTIDEARAMDGREPLPDGLGAEPMVFTASGPMLLKNVLNPPPPPENLGSGIGVQGSEIGVQGSGIGDQGSGVQGAKGKSDEQKAQKDNPEGKDQAGKGKEQPVKKLEKADKKVKKIKPIDRERKAVLKGRSALEKLFAKAFIAARSAAEKLGTGIGAQGSVEKMMKSDTDTEAKVKQILDQLELEGFAVITDDIEEILAAVTKDGVYQALLQIGLKDDAMTEGMRQAAVDYATEHAATLIRDVTQSTRDMLRSDVTHALEEGWSTGKFTDALAENYGFSAERASTIARTEIGNADIRGNVIAYKESGVVSGKEWILGSEHDNDDDCDENAGDGVIPFDEPFSSGDMWPLAHPNCTCDVLPVLADKEEE